jgi:RNA polymerase sigma factor (sigma-70 family)
MYQKDMTGDDHLWQSFIDGSMEAYGRIYQLYVRPMYLYGLHFCDDSSIIEDAIHDIFVRIYTNRRKLPELKNVKLYLLISLKNALLNHSNSKSFRFRMNISGCNFLADMSDTEGDIFRKEDTERNKRLVSEMEKNLSVRQKQAVYYRFVEQMHYNEIGTMMEINTQSAKNLVHSSIKKIREIYPHLSSASFTAMLLFMLLII